MNTIRSIYGTVPPLMNPVSKTTPSPTPQDGGSSFLDRLKGAMTDVNDRQIVADTSSEQVIQGKMGLLEGMMAVQEADVSLRYMLQVRGKAVDAYREIMRMQF